VNLWPVCLRRAVATLNHLSDTARSSVRQVLPIKISFESSLYGRLVHLKLLKYFEILFIAGRISIPG